MFLEHRTSGHGNCRQKHAAIFPYNATKRHFAGEKQPMMSCLFFAFYTSVIYSEVIPLL